MEVRDYKVYRVIYVDKVVDLKIGTELPIPIERADFNGNKMKNQIESVFESIRSSSFSFLQSRKSCLFVLPHDDMIVEQWVREQNPHNCREYYLVEISLSGNLIWCDQDLFSDAALTTGELLQQKAIDYWSTAGEDYSNFGMPEGLFVGTAVVVHIEEKIHNAE